MGGVLTQMTRPFLEQAEAGGREGREQHGGALCVKVYKDSAHCRARRYQQHINTADSKWTPAVVFWLHVESWYPARYILSAVYLVCESVLIDTCAWTK